MSVDMEGILTSLWLLINYQPSTESVVYWNGHNNRVVS
jgi:hypothetical protein